MQSLSFVCRFIDDDTIIELVIDDHEFYTERRYRLSIPQIVAILCMVLSAGGGQWKYPETSRRILEVLDTLC